MIKNNNYYNISYDKARLFLENLEDNKLEKIAENYIGITEVNKQNKKLVINEIAESLSDSEFYGLGYDEKIIEESLAIQDERGYRYITKHGVGPGTLPRDVKLMDWEDLPNYRTAIWLDRFLTTKELNEYDIYPESVQEGITNVASIGIPNYTIKQIEGFLQELDENILQNLHNKYNTYNNNEELAIAMTDNEIENLGFKVLADNEELKDEQDILQEDCNDFDNIFKPHFEQDYDENLEYIDYLEDIANDIYYAILDISKENEQTYLFEQDTDFNRFKECLDVNLIESYEKLSEDENGIVVNITPKTYKNDDNDNKIRITEDVVINDELNSSIFDEDDKMIESVREELLEYAENFVEAMIKKDIVVDYKDIQLVGSNAGYLYTENSDIDIHYVLKEPTTKIKAEALMDEFDLFEAENPLIINDKNIVELGVEDGNEYALSLENSRRYSIIDDKWVDNSDSFEVYNKDDINFVDGYEKIVKDYEQRIDDVISADEYADAIELKLELRQNRSYDLTNIGQLSMGNVVFKELRNSGYYNKLKEYIVMKEAEKLQ